MLDVINPADGSLLARVETDDRDAIAAKAAAARRAQPDWAQRPLSERKQALAAFRQRTIDERERLARLLSQEVGKPIAQSRNELAGLLPRIDFFIDAIDQVLAPQTVLDDASAGMREEIGHEPLGTVANVSAWNYPYFVGANVFVPALLAGNAVLY
ncbi:MAG TPA: aldehyde dehydrogenase family protein, partial [Burkholderiaceae bacterium]|nr:aldehyde dehydrogenase family protein [Burkholderiaceae bacterium]